MAFRKPAKTKIGGKFLTYGFTGEGKSYFGLTFPKIGAIDSETGLAFYEDTDIEINGWSGGRYFLNSKNFTQKNGKIFLLVICSESHNDGKGFLRSKVNEVLVFVGQEDFEFNTFLDIAGQWDIMTSDEVLLEEVKRKIETKGNDEK